MNSYTLTNHYSLPKFGPTFGGLLSHFLGRQSFVRDAEDTDAECDVEQLWRARVHSGDYFMTLATELDELAQSIAATDNTDAAQLERLVNELIYVGRHFRIVKNAETKD